MIDSRPYQNLGNMHYKRDTDSSDTRHNADYKSRKQDHKNQYLKK